MKMLMGVELTGRLIVHLVRLRMKNGSIKYLYYDSHYFSNRFQSMVNFIAVANLQSTILMFNKFSIIHIIYLALRLYKSALH